jgi:CubicO group peptidase (beta-lactamase class C family)
MPLSSILLSFLTAGADLDAIASSHYPANEPGAAVLVMKDGEVLLRKGYGMADLEQGIPVAPDMVFRIGSVTKQFTAAAILLLEEEGKLSVKDDLRKHLPDYPAGGRVITLEHLLTHTSGIRSYTGMEEFWKEQRRDMSVEELIGVFRDQPLDFEPGSKWSYNNSGYVLLGAIIEKVSGKSYEAFLQERIFEPLGMSRTYYGSASRIIPGRAQGYDFADDAFQNAAYLSMTLPYSAGSLLSTVDDLAKWDRALYGTEVLSRESLDKWWRASSLANGESTHYGYGWGISSYEGHRVIWHSGGINGFTCNFLRMPDDRLMVAVLTNRSYGKSRPEVVSMKLAASAIGKPLDEKTTALDPNVLAKRAGLFRAPTGARYLLTLDSGKLRLQRFDDVIYGDSGTLLPLSESEFLVEGSLTRVTFEGSALVVDDWGHVRRAERSDEPTDDPSRVVAAVQKLFDAVTAKDGEALRSVLDPAARLVRTESRKGAPQTRPMSAADFVNRILEHEGPPLREKIWDPEVRVADNLATVWVPYAFYVGEKLMHCGEDAIQLARTEGSWPGWQIVAIADTQRTAGCSPP